MNIASPVTRVPAWILGFLLPALAHAADYYVAPNGNDANPGTLAGPFRTIRKAADTMHSGDRCLIRAGTYRETVTVAGDNLSFQAYRDEHVVISGADRVTGWTRYSGEIYKAGLSGVQPPFTQVFFRGQRQPIARYPDNLSGNMLSIADKAGYAACVVKRDGAVSFDAPLPGPPNFWVGGYFRAISGLTWANPTGIITASKGRHLTCDPISTTWKQGSRITLGPGKGYILHLHALSRPGEWYYQNNTLYFWRPGGGKPGPTEVEAQKRTFAFVADGCDRLTLKRLNFRAASLRLRNCNACLVRNCTFRNLKGWFTRPGYAVSYTQLGGVYVSGSRNTIRGCTFNGSWGSLLCLAGGRNNVVTNSILGNNGWMGMFTSCIQNRSYNLTVSHCTFGPTGRFQIRSSTKVNITYNDFYGCMKMGQDAGAVEVTSGGRADTPVFLDGAEIAYNRFHDIGALKSFVNRKQFVAALYMEGAEGYTVHHNLVYNVKTGSRDGAFCYLGPREARIRDCRYYNNTVWNCDWRICLWNPNGAGALEGVTFANNLFDSRMPDRSGGKPNLLPSVVFRNNVVSSDAAALFENSASGDFRLKAGSPAIDRGIAIKGITDGFRGKAPDAGCYEHGAPAWTCGATIPVPRFPGDR